MRDFIHRLAKELQWTFPALAFIAFVEGVKRGSGLPDGVPDGA